MHAADEVAYAAALDDTTKPSGGTLDVEDAGVDLVLELAALVVDAVEYMIKINQMIK